MTRRPPVAQSASMADVAAIAGVSHQTVSRVVNQPDKVRPETRERVERAMAELDYRPNAAARALVTRSSRLIGLVMPGENLFGPTTTMVALDRAARERGFSTTVGVLTSPEDVGEVLGRFLGLNVDAVVVIAPDQSAVDAAHALSQRLPVAVIRAGGETGVSGLAGVHVDQAEGARQVVHHLAAAGAARIDHVAGPLDWFDASARVAGWRDALDELDLPGELVVAGWRAEQGHRAAGELLRASKGHGAVFCANDQLALGVVHRALELGVRVPEDLLLAGFDDSDGAGHFCPPLTSVHQPLEEAGRRAVELVLELREGGAARQVRVLPRLVVRASSSRPA